MRIETDPDPKHSNKLHNSSPTTYQKYSGLQGGNPGPTPRQQNAGQEQQQLWWRRRKNKDLQLARRKMDAVTYNIYGTGTKYTVFLCPVSGRKPDITAG